MKIRGATPEARSAARRVQTARNRADFYLGEVRAAKGRPQAQVEQVCRWLRAIAHDLPASEASGLVQAASDLARAWNARTAS